jgi:hypothetical protein
VYNFEEKQEDYLEEDANVPVKVGRQSLVLKPVGSSNRTQLSPFAKTAGIYNRHSDQELTVKKQPYDIIAISKPMVSSQRGGLDY